MVYIYKRYIRLPLIWPLAQEAPTNAISRIRSMTWKKFRRTGSSVMKELYRALERCTWGNDPKRVRRSDTTVLLKTSSYQHNQKNKWHRTMRNGEAFSKETQVAVKNPWNWVDILTVHSQISTVFHRRIMVYFSHTVKRNACDGHLRELKTQKLQALDWNGKCKQWQTDH